MRSGAHRPNPPNVKKAVGGFAPNLAQRVPGAAESNRDDLRGIIFRVFFPTGWYYCWIIMQVDSSHLARRLSFGAAIDGEANRFPMHKFVEYVQIL